MLLDAIVFGGTPRGVADDAAAAEALGYDGVWLTEGAQPVYSLATAAALATSRVTLGTGIAVAFARSPMVTAQAAWMLAQATDGRFVLGLGTQVRAHVERRYAAAFDHPGPRLRDYVAAVRACFAAFRGGRLAHDGPFYQLSLLPAAWTPPPIPHPDPPVYLAGVNPWMCRMIGAVADGMHVHPLHSARYLREVVRPQVATGARGAGRHPDVVTYTVPVMTITGSDEASWAASREQVRSRIAFYGSTPGYDAVFDTEGYPGTGGRLRERLAARDLAGMAAVITDEMLARYAVEAPPGQLGAALAERYRGLADRLICYSASRGSDGMWQDVLRDVRAHSPEKST